VARARAAAGTITTSRLLVGHTSQGSSSFTVVRNPDSVDKGNDPQHLRHAYIHFFTTPVCSVSEYFSGTAPAPDGRVLKAALTSASWGEDLLQKWPRVSMSEYNRGGRHWIDHLEAIGRCLLPGATPDSPWRSLRLG
jgi:hypothetical protein